jgi:hypothetical protein
MIYGRRRSGYCVELSDGELLAASTFTRWSWPAVVKRCSARLAGTS